MAAGASTLKLKNATILYLGDESLKIPGMFVLLSLCPLKICTGTAPHEKAFILLPLLKAQ